MLKILNIGMIGLLLAFVLVLAGCGIGRPFHRGHHYGHHQYDFSGDPNGLLHSGFQKYSTGSRTSDWR